HYRSACPGGGGRGARHGRARRPPARASEFRLNRKIRRGVEAAFRRALKPDGGGKADPLVLRLPPAVEDRAVPFDRGAGRGQVEIAAALPVQELVTDLNQRPDAVGLEDNPRLGGEPAVAQPE